LRRMAVNLEPPTGADATLRRQNRWPRADDVRIGSSGRGQIQPRPSIPLQGMGLGWERPSTYLFVIHLVTLFVARRRRLTGLGDGSARSDKAGCRNRRSAHTLCDTDTAHCWVLDSSTANLQQPARRTAIAPGSSAHIYTIQNAYSHNRPCVLIFIICASYSRLRSYSLLMYAV